MRRKITQNKHINMAYGQRENFYLLVKALLCLSSFLLLSLPFFFPSYILYFALSQVLFRGRSCNLSFSCLSFSFFFFLFFISHLFVYFFASLLIVASLLFSSFVFIDLFVTCLFFCLFLSFFAPLDLFLSLYSVGTAITV